MPSIQYAALQQPVQRRSRECKRYNPPMVKIHATVVITALASAGTPAAELAITAECAMANSTCPTPQPKPADNPHRHVEQGTVAPAVVEIRPTYPQVIGITVTPVS